MNKITKYYFKAFLFTSVLTFTLLISFVSYGQSPTYFCSGNYANPNNWSQGSSASMSSIVGTSILTTTPNGSGNQYFRLYSATSGGTIYEPNGGSDILLNNGAITSLQVTGSGKAYYLNIANSSSNVVFKTRGSGTPGTSTIVAYEIQGAIRTVSSVTQSPSSNVQASQSVTVTANLSGSLATGQGVWLRYTTNGFSGSTILQMTGSGTTYTGTIPAQASGTNVIYYVFTSGTPASIAHGDADLATINLNNNGGSNYTYTTIPSQYTWNQTGTASYAIASNWTPTRTTPATSDVLSFNNGATTTVTNIPAETIGGLIVSGNTTVNLQPAATNTLTIGNGVSGYDLSIASGSALNANGSNALSITLSTGATASINGNMTFSTAANTLIGTDASSITFNSGSAFTQGSGSTGGVFGTSGTANTVIFANGSKFEQFDGSNPFQLTAPSSKVVFQTGSLFKLSGAIAPDFAGRTYANFEYNNSGTSTATGSSGVTMDNLTVTLGTFNSNVSSTSSIKGNILVASGANLYFSPASAATINLNGTGVQTITISGTLSVGSNANLTVVSGSTVDMGTSIIIGTGTFTTAVGSTFRTGNIDGITAAGGGATGSIQTTTRSFNSAANFVYNGTANQITGTGLPSTVNTLTINNTGSGSNNIVTLSAITGISSTTNSLRLQAGKLDLDNKQLTIPNGGSVASTGGDFAPALGTIFFIGAGSTSGTLNFPNVRMANAGGVNFGLGSNIISSLTLEAGSYLTSAPTYATNSTLIYNTGGTYGRNVEWGSLSGPGYPYNVSIIGGTTLDLSSGGFALNRAIAGNLTLGAAGTSSTGNLFMGAMTNSLVVSGNIVIGGTTSGSNTLTLSTAVGGDIYLSGNWDTKINGSYTSNTRAVFFQGAGTSTVTTIGAATFDYLFINKTSGGTVTLANDMTVNNNLTLNAQLVTTVAYKVIIPNGSGVTANTGGWVNGKLQKDIPTGTSSRTFEVGDTTTYAPVTTTYSGVTTAGDIIVKTTANDHIQIAASGIDNAKSVNRFYSITNSGVDGGTYDATFNFASGDIDGGASTSNFVVRSYVNPNWFATSTGTKTSTATQATGLSTYGDFQIGEAKPIVVSVQPNNVNSCVGVSASFTSSSSSTPAPTVKWQRNDGSGFVDVDGVMDGGVYSNFTTTTLAISNATGLNGYTYQAIFANINGTVTSISATLTVNALPTVSIVTNNDPICSGDDALFYISGTANAVVTYNVNGGSDLTTILSGSGIGTITVVAVTATTTVQLTKVTNPTTTCFENISDFSTVNVYAIPTASITGNNGSVCSGENAEYYLSGTSGAEVTYNINGGTSQTVILTGGTATVSVPATGTMVFNIEFVTNIATSCYQLLSGTSTVTSYANVWNGGTGNWNVAANWSCGVVPNSATIVEINAGAATITADAACYSLTMTGTPTLTVNSNYDLTVVDSIDVSAITSGTGITVQNNANLLQNGTTNSNIGTKVNVVRDSSPLNRLDYTIWSSPTSGTQTLANFSPLTAVNRYYTYNEATDAYVGNSGSGTFDTAKGYLIRMPNTWVAVPGTPSSWTGAFSGKPNSGNITYSMVKTTNGYNAVGNPYPSAISIADFIDYNVDNYSNIGGTIWLWRKTNNPANTTYYSTCTNAGCTLENGHSYTDDTLLSTAQGFLVQATTSGSSTLYFNNEMRSSTNVNQFFRTNTMRDRYWLELKNDDDVSFGTKLITHMPNASNGYDTKLDGLYINDRTTALLSVVDDKQLVIQARPSFDVNDIIPLLFKTDTAGNYSITLRQFEGVFANGQNVLLRDNQAGTVHDLSVTGAYNFSSEAGSFASRFEVVYQNALSNATFNENAIVLYNNNHTIHVNTGKVTMDKVSVFDVRGRLLVEKNKVNTSEITIDGSKMANQVLLIQITSDEGTVVTKKIVN